MLSIPRELITVLTVKDGQWVLKDNATDAQKQKFQKFLKESKQEEKNLGLSKG